MRPRFIMDGCPIAWCVVCAHSTSTSTRKCVPKTNEEEIVMYKEHISEVRLKTKSYARPK